MLIENCSPFIYPLYRFLALVILGDQAILAFGNYKLHRMTTYANELSTTRWVFVSLALLALTFLVLGLLIEPIWAILTEVRIPM